MLACFSQLILELHDLQTLVFQLACIVFFLVLDDMLQLKHLCFVMVYVNCETGCLLDVRLFLFFKLLLILLHRFFQSGKLTVHTALQIFLLIAVLLAEVGELLAKILNNPSLFLSVCSRLAVIMVQLLDQSFVLLTFLSKSLYDFLGFVNCI